MSHPYINYKTTLLPILQKRANPMERSNIAKLKNVRSKDVSIDYLKLPEYKNKDAGLETNGYKIVRDVFMDDENLIRLHKMSDIYNVNMHEFADKDTLFAQRVKPILSNSRFIQEYRNVYGGPFLWQKTTIHRKVGNEKNKLNKRVFTSEHMDISETPNSKLIITAYIAISDQNTSDMSKLLIYPKSHHCEIKIPKYNFDYVSNLSENEKSRLIAKINMIVEENNELMWIQECLYYLIVMDRKEYEVLKSTFLLMLFNPKIFTITPEEIRLRRGDVLFFLSNVLHASTIHGNNDISRVSLAVRGGYPYYEKSKLISNCVNEYFYTKEKKRRNHFLFSGTENMIDDIKNRKDFNDIIHQI